MKELIEKIIALKSNKNSNRIGYISSFTPEEILYAAELCPCLINGDNITSYPKAQTYLHRNICSYILSCLEQGFNDNSIKGIIIGHTCDAARRLYDVWKHYISTKFTYFLDVPRTVTPVSIKYFENQLVDLIASIESVYSIKITKEKLIAAIDLCNASRKLLQEFFHLRSKYALDIKESENIDIFKSSVSGNKHEFNKQMVNLLNTSKKLVTTDKSNSQNIVVCGSFFDAREIVDIIEKHGVKVICEDTELGISNFEKLLKFDNGNIIGSIAKHYLNKIICSRIINTEKRFKHLYNLITSYNVKGVVYYSLKFCDNNLMDYAYIKNELDKRSIPILFIEGERNTVNIEQIKTRLGAFLEGLFLF